MKKITTIIGTRPEIIKMARVIPLLDQKFDHQLIFTSQHYSQNMVDIFFDELKVRKPNLVLEAKSSNHESLIKPIQSAIKQSNPDNVIVYGDTNSTLAAAISAKSLGIKITHIEAGLRSYDKKMPEENNRILVDHISDYLLSPTELERDFLKKENITENVKIVGNTVVDACLFYQKMADKKSKIHDSLEITKYNYILVTAHRQENVDNPSGLLKMLQALADLPLKIVFPMHPRTKNRIMQGNYYLPENILVIDPLGYFDFLKLMNYASLIITDSGGVQEEAITLHVPCLTIRTTTERLATVTAGGNFLVGLDPEIVKYYTNMITSTDLGKKMRKAKNPYGNGDASKLIIEACQEFV